MHRKSVPAFFILAALLCCILAAPAPAAESDVTWTFRKVEITEGNNLNVYGTLVNHTDKTIVGLGTRKFHFTRNGQKRSITSEKPLTLRTPIPPRGTGSLYFTVNNASDSLDNFSSDIAGAVFGAPAQKQAPAQKPAATPARKPAPAASPSPGLRWNFKGATWNKAENRYYVAYEFISDSPDRPLVRLDNVTLTYSYKKDKYTNNHLVMRADFQTVQISVPPLGVKRHNFGLGQGHFYGVDNLKLTCKPVFGPAKSGSSGGNKVIIIK